MSRETGRMELPGGPGDGPQHGGRRGGCRPAASFSALLAALAACGAADRAGAPATAVRDSAGIAIVESAAVPRLEEHGWRIADSPSVVIGRGDGDPGQNLHQVRGAVRLADARIVVADHGSSELRFYDPQGRFLFAAGRGGGGPGEFRSLGSVHVYGDSLLAEDGALRRVSVFDTAGRFARSFQIEVREAQAGPVLLGALDGGRLVVRTINFGEPEALRTGVGRHPNVYWMHDPAGAVLDSVAMLPGWEAFSLNDPERGIAIGNLPIPFSRTALAAVGAGRLLLADNERPEYRAYDAAGRLVRIVRWTPPLPPPPVTDEEIESFKASALDHAPPSMRRDLQIVYAEMPFPQTRTPFQAIRLDAGGCVWARTWPPAGSERPSATIFDAGGHALGTLELPRVSVIHEIGADYLLAGVIDDLGIESVHVYALERAAGC